MAVMHEAAGERALFERRFHEPIQLRPLGCPYKRFVPMFFAAAVLAGCGSSSAEAKPKLVGLGDSYASGEGIAPYASGSDTETNRCHQSINSAYSTLAATELGFEGFNQSCSGATTATMASQLTNLQGADYVTITIGGNDIQALSSLISLPSAEALKATWPSCSQNWLQLSTQ